ncbi:hypothetical protein [Caulobacter soli]|uniref:hypothetical protein n=1 Tax=Caulobacter soli TaxID=2708539 RepID=UPI0013EA3A8E|nr:hypothetical protein [Caulobacter soli]
MASEREPVGLSATGGMAISFVVLLEGVTNGDAAKNPATWMYPIAGAMLAASGLSIVFSGAIAGEDPPEARRSMFAMTKPLRISGALVSIISDFSIQILAVMLGYQIAKRAGTLTEQAFILVLFAGFVVNGLSSMVVECLLTLAIFYKRIIERRGREVSPRVNTFIHALEEKAKPPNPAPPLLTPKPEAEKTPRRRRRAAARRDLGNNDDGKLGP